MRTIHKTALLGSAAMLTLLASAPGAWAQTAPAPALMPTTEEQEAASNLDDVVVVGSQIRGAAVNAALPVTVMNEEQILATGAVNGDDLLRSIPQMGDVLFSAANNPQTSNAARGDVNSVNLRSLGVSSTRVLLRYRSGRGAAGRGGCHLRRRCCGGRGEHGAAR
jgi:iron complex outermembrane receptor protein